jgi:hypothetical protein
LDGQPLGEACLAEFRIIEGSQHNWAKWNFLVHCRHTTRIWSSAMEWLGIIEGNQHNWANLTISEWWEIMAGGFAQNRKGMASVTLLVTFF